MPVTVQKLIPSSAEKAPAPKPYLVPALLGTLEGQPLTAAAPLKPPIPPAKPMQFKAEWNEATWQMLNRWRTPPTLEEQKEIWNRAIKRF